MDHYSTQLPVWKLFWYTNYQTEPNFFKDIASVLSTNPSGDCMDIPEASGFIQPFVFCKFCTYSVDCGIGSYIVQIQLLEMLHQLPQCSNAKSSLENHLVNCLLQPFSNLFSLEQPSKKFTGLREPQLGIILSTAHSTLAMLCTT